MPSKLSLSGRVIGGHVSAAGGVLKALQRARELEFAAIQLHPTAPQSWGKPSIDPETATAFKTSLAENGVQIAFFHNIYLNNFASPLDSIWHGSIEVSKSYLTAAAALGVKGAVTHLGSHKGLGLDEVLPRLTEGVKRVIADAPAEAVFIIENTAGGGGSIGRSLEEIEKIMTALRPTRHKLGVCIDTCHAFAAGIPIHTSEGAAAFVAEFKERLGLEHLLCLHVNDSKFPFASFRDRHENIGDGFIGREGFKSILMQPELAEVPLIMEVPGLENKGPDAANRDRLREIFTS